MIRFACSSCRVGVKAPERKAGRWSVCPHCGITLQVPKMLDYHILPPSVREPDVELVDLPVAEEILARTSIFWPVWWIGFFILTALLIIIASCQYQMLSSPTTCQEVVQLLQAKGLKNLSWSSTSPLDQLLLRHPAALIHWEDEEFFCDALLVQFPSSVEAKQWAGMHPRAFAWKQFAFRPEPIPQRFFLVEEIKKRL